MGDQVRPIVVTVGHGPGRLTATAADPALRQGQGSHLKWERSGRMGKVAWACMVLPVFPSLAGAGVVVATTGAAPAARGGGRAVLAGAVLVTVAGTPGTPAADCSGFLPASSWTA